MKVKFEHSVAHFAKDMRPSHGPQNWPCWLRWHLLRQAH